MHENTDGYIKEKNLFIFYQNANSNNQFNPNFKINYNFGSFEKPKIDINNKYCLNICLDHSFEIEKNEYFLFIDHHLIERLIESNELKNEFVNNYYKEYCSSNANLMYNIYENIIEIIRSLNFNEVNVFMHADLDGIASGIIMKQILEDSRNYKMSKNDILFVRMLGNYGDLYEYAKYDLTDYFDDPNDVLIFDKKIKTIVKNLGRFMKAIRPCLNYYCNTNKNSKLSNFTKEVIELEDLLERIGINPIQFENFLNNIILKDIENFKKIDVFTIIMYLNRITSNIVYKAINIEFQKLIDSIVKEYLEPDFPQIELSIIFKKDTKKTVYKLLTIETPFDCGRSVIWKYRSSYKQLLYKDLTLNKWNYKLTDWKNKNHANMMKNIACYNKTLNKLTLDGESESSYNIATSFTSSGGGHCNTISEGVGSIGSVKVLEDEFINSIIVKEFF